MCIVEWAREWQTVITLGAVIGTVTATAIVAIYAIKQSRHSKKQLEELSKSRNADIMLKVFEIMDALRDKWHAVYKLPKAHGSWSNSQRKLADHVGTQLQRVAYLAVTELVDSKHIKESYGGVFHQCWLALENSIKDYREECGESRELKEGTSHQRMHFEKFALE